LNREDAKDAKWDLPLARRSQLRQAVHPSRVSLLLAGPSFAIFASSPFNELGTTLLTGMVR
jgi:hypothetical protein